MSFLVKPQQRCGDSVNHPVASLVRFLEQQPSEVSLKEQQHADETELMRQHLELASKSISG